MNNDICYIEWCTFLFHASNIIIVEIRNKANQYNVKLILGFKLCPSQRLEHIGFYFAWKLLLIIGVVAGLLWHYVNPLTQLFQQTSSQYACTFGTPGHLCKILEKVSQVCYHDASVHLHTRS